MKFLMHKKLNNNDKENILKNFPNVKLSYENIIHNKVENNELHKYDLYLAIPCGRKCFGWITSYNNEYVCFIMELQPNKTIKDIEIFVCSFNKELTYGCGTIFYGTYFNFKQNNFFAIENIYFYKGSDISNYNWYDKFNIIGRCFNYDLNQVSYNKKYIVFGFPLLSNSLSELKKSIDLIEYKIYSIQFRKLNKINSYDTNLFKNIDFNIPVVVSVPPIQLSKEIVVDKTRKPQIRQPHKRIIFNIRPDIQNDIYHLYCLNEQIETYYKVAYIPDYKTSVMMNKLFRNIKENENLDLLEESDDEEEFQNEREDRFVNLNLCYKMVCGFNYKFKKWFPIGLAGESENIIQQYELNLMDKK